MKKTLIFVCFVLGLNIIYSQNIDMDLVEARDEFRWGVMAFHSGYFDKAVLSLERSFALKPENIRTQYWLGETYRRLGFEETALKIWKNIEDSGKADPLLINRIDSLNFKRGLGRELSEEGKYVPAYEIKGKFSDFEIFERPISVSVLNDGSYFLSSFTTNEVLYMDANGAVKEKLQGGIKGLDHPFGTAVYQNKWLFVSEFKGDRLVRMDFHGGNISRFGSSGSGEGELSGPQFISVDDEGYLYVTEIGNRRVSKFSTEGEFLFSFGSRTEFFQGLKSPSGILAYTGRVFVSDSRDACIHVFDSSGNYLYTLGEGILKSPEGLSVHSDGSVLIADTGKIMHLDLENRKFSELASADDKKARIVDVALDANKNLLAVDFNGNKVDFFTEVNEFYSGLVVDISSVQSAEYPKVRVCVDVSNRMGDPFTGLKETNFLITESGTGIEEPVMIAEGQKIEHAEYSLILEESPASSADPAEYKEAAGLLKEAFGEGGTGHLVHAGSEAVLFPQTAAYSGFDEENVSSSWDLDTGIFLAAGQLINKPSRKAVILITGGELPPDTFDDYSLLQLSNFLVNNKIAFYVVYTSSMDRYPRELEYLAERSGGESRYLYQPEGLVGIADTLMEKRDGSYILEYTSHSDTDFGQKYLDLEVEVSLFSRSGRDEKGYFAPAF